jgi:AraC family transcriptional regulator of adaptative response / DNA-3-methyladenine glycosylase II
VRGSRVYCRSICPAPTAKEENCIYYATAAAAAEAGYRPCLRCRPESSPGTPAWLGTSTTVSRALRLIGESGLDDGGIEGLADHLGVGSRHLRRLFLRHLGATPIAVAQTRRVHFAKKLIEETSLPMTELAIAAGYGSVRRFNAAVAKTFHRTPTHIRAHARTTRPLPENEYMFRLRFRPPFHWTGMLSYLAAFATPGVESVGGGTYRRSISWNGTDGSIEVDLDESQYALNARIRFADPRALFHIAERIRAMFDLNADWGPIVSCLGGDPLLARRLRTAPGLRVPGCWNGFELAVRAIIGRQADGDVARDLAGRMARALGRPFPHLDGVTHLFPEPRVLAETDLAALGFSQTFAAIVRALARGVCDRQIVFEGVADSESFLARLRSITGMDAWTAQIVAMRALGEPDAFPDPVRRGASRGEFDDRAQSWRPWRAYAAMYLSAAQNAVTENAASNRAPTL